MLVFVQRIPFMSRALFESFEEDEDVSPYARGTASSFSSLNESRVIAYSPLEQA
jgi:hypothetical protein